MMINQNHGEKIMANIPDTTLIRATKSGIFKSPIFSAKALKVGKCVPCSALWSATIEQKRQIKMISDNKSSIKAL